MSVDRMSKLSCDYIGGTAYSSRSEANSELYRLTEYPTGTPEHDPGWRSNSYWCATTNGVWETTGWDCWYKNKGEYFLTKTEAEAEQNNLQLVSGTGVWCITDKSKVQYTTEAKCKTSGQTGFSNNSFYSKALAEAEAKKRVPWCVTPEHMFDLNGFGLKTIVPEIYCSGGKLFYSKAAAEAEFLSLRFKKDRVNQRQENTAYCFDEDSDKYYFGPYKDPWNAGCSPGDLEVSLHEYIQETSVPILPAEVVWCATALGTSKTIKSDCNEIGGKNFPNELQAKNEHYYLKHSDPFGIYNSDNDNSKYVNAIERHPNLIFALAISTDSRGEGSGSTVLQAKEDALQNCRDSYGTDHDCKIVDVNGTWPFIDKVWCTTASAIVTTTRKLCDDWNGKAYSTKILAGTEFQRTKDGGRATASTSGGTLIWCGKSFKRSCSEKTESLTLHPSTGWCASPWQVRYTSRQKCGRTDEELWPTRSGAQTAHTRLRKEHYEGLNVVVWCATAESFEKTRITDCESIDGTIWSTEALARAEHNRLKSVSSVAQAQVSKKVWCATALDTWETTESTCRSLGGRHFGDRRVALNESARRLKAQKDREQIQQKNEAIARRKQNLEKLLATKSCRECDLRGVDLRKADLNGAILVKANLQGASLVMASLEGSNLTGANLREVDLTGANLAKATLRKADLSQAHVTPRFLNLFPTNLSWADLSEAKLVGANLAGVNFTGAVLTQADLTRANLMNVDLDDADLSGAILIETSLIEANLDHADLTDANLSRANLTDACLDRTNLSRANLSNTFLSKATFRKANLNQVNLQKARLNNADLSGIDLRGADLSGANLTRANLRGTGLEGAQLHGANLYEADLTGADLSRADLEGVNLIRARLRIADLRWSNLSGAELDGAKLVGANLTGANLTRASLNRSDLSRANLTKADLSGADLNRADLSRTALIQAILVGADLYRATLDKADLSQADLTNADLTGVSSQEVIWDQVVLCGTMMQSRVIDDSGCKPDRKSTEPINHRS